jgi:hypothetical protein
MSRRQRQLDALRDLCRTGAVARAVDLAFEHFAVFGTDDEIVELLALAIDDVPTANEIRRRFVELRRSRG